MNPNLSPVVENSLLWRRWAPLAIWGVTALLALFIPLQILKQGYLPEDDALRHVGKALSGKAWPEILEVHDGYGGDEHPGWHAILGAMHRWFGWEADGLVAFSVVAPFALYWLALLAWRRRPEALLAVLFVASLAAPSTFIRPLFGRPFGIILVVMVLVLQLWVRSRRISWPQVLLTVGLIGFSVWVHGSWYLFGIVVAAFALSGHWDRGLRLAGCWLAGVALGAVLTGRPVAYLHETTSHLFDVFGGPTLNRMLVTELQPDSGDLLFVLALGLLAVWRAACSEWRRESVINPVFALAALGWLLGLKISRFWTDWGFPAAILWAAMELEAALEEKLSRERVAAALLAAFAAAGVYIATTRDSANRWTHSLSTVFLSPNDPNLPRIDEWMPGRGGLVYSVDMNVFFRTFYRNPHAEWRYVLGFEPGILPRADRETLRDIQRRGTVSETLGPWLRKMRQEDRLILLQPNKPVIPELEWYFAGGDTWIGRLPRPGFGAH